MHKLSNDEKTLLLDLFEFQGVQQSIDPARFRLRHEHRLAMIDSLINSGYIREQVGRYSLDLLALTELSSQEVIKLLDACDALWLELQIHYRKNLVAQVSLSQLAHESGVAIELVRKSMGYMIEFPWYASCSSEFPFHENAAVGPQEKVIRLASFRQAIEERRSWKIAFQQNNLSHRLPLPTGNSLVPAKDGVSKAVATPWHDSLKEPLATILREVFGARSAGYRTIAAMGVRAVIDLVCTEIAGDKSTFKQKIEEIQRLGYLSADECSAVAAAFDAGSASAHRGYLINEQNLENLIEIMEHLLRRKFRIGQAAHKIIASTPQRTRL